MSDKFWNRVKIGSTEECWPWTGFIKKTGYGYVRINNVTWRAHRLAWTLAVGQISSDEFVCHRCDNPRCCNPSHLFLGTPADNMADMHAKGRFVNPSHAKGERAHGSKLSNADVVLVRGLVADGLSHRKVAERFGVSHNIIGRIARLQHRSQL